MQVEKTENIARTLTLFGREKASLTGVEDVLRFDEQAVICRTTLGELVLEGSSLRIIGFSSTEGTLVLCGEITGFFYEEKKGKGKSGIFRGAR